MNRGSDGGWAAWMMAMLAMGCARAPDAAQASSAPGPTSASALAAATADPPAVATASAVAPEIAAASPAEGTSLPAGIDFFPQAQVIFRVAACGLLSIETDAIPARFDASVVSHHCDDLGRAYEEYRRGWVDVARPFLAALRPKNLPGVVVYPFGGGDLVSALATFPDATEITTISLEPAGDVRPIDTLAPDRLAHELAIHRSHLERLFEKAHSRTDNLAKEAQTELPGELLFALAALVVHGAEPVSLRYFRLGRDGSLLYVTQADLDAARGPARASERRALFANAELRFRRSGDARSPVQILRHVSFNLDDAHLAADPGLLAYLNERGKVATMTKAATHLLWDEHFRLIRGWLVEHTDWMASDSTGLPPRIAGPAGFTQDAYGRFDGPSPFGSPDRADSDDVKRLFASQPVRDLPFRYGYPDSHGHAHLIVTHRVSR